MGGLSEALASTLGDVLGSPIRSVSGVSGGDINDAFDLRLRDGRRVFFKHRSDASRGHFAAEAKGLGWLSQVEGVHVPEVLAVLETGLALSWVEAGSGSSDASLGRMIAALHGRAEASAGLEYDNWIATLPQSNAEVHGTWADFYRERRLQPLVERAGDALEPRDRRAFERLYARLARWCVLDEGPARLHGDLWSGNVVHGRDGPALIDPAVYAGDRELDLAMMSLFGGFSDGVLEAYDELLPRRPGHEDRLPLYQLYPLLVHVCLFGGGYAGRVREILRRYV
jgi:fructosamine-3-kinase